MSADNISPETAAATLPAAPDPDSTSVGEINTACSGPESQSQPASSHGRAIGKVSRLPKSIRDQINHLLFEGVPYHEIITRLGDHGKDLTIDNISQWKKRAHQDWLAEQSFIERIRARQETPAELVRDFDGTEVNHAALQLGTLHIFEALRELGPGSLNEKLGGDCAAFARLINALARASRETMLVQKYREACARARATLQELRNPKRELSEEERHAIIMHVDNILGLNTVGDIDWRDIPLMGGRNVQNPNSTAKDNNQQQQHIANLTGGNGGNEVIQNPQTTNVTEGNGGTEAV